MHLCRYQIFLGAYIATCNTVNRVKVLSCCALANEYYFPGEKERVRARFIVENTVITPNFVCITAWYPPNCLFPVQSTTKLRMTLSIAHYNATIVNFWTTCTRAFGHDRMLMVNISHISTDICVVPANACANCGPFHPGVARNACPAIDDHAVNIGHESWPILTA